MLFFNTSKVKLSRQKMDIKNAPPEKFFYDTDTDGTGELKKRQKKTHKKTPTMKLCRKKNG